LSKQVLHSSERVLHSGAGSLTKVAFAGLALLELRHLAPGEVAASVGLTAAHLFSAAPRWWHATSFARHPPVHLHLPEDRKSHRPPRTNAQTF
jgi:hypothetical protein